MRYADEHGYEEKGTLMKKIKRIAYLMLACLLLVSCNSSDNKINLRDRVGTYKNFVVNETLALEIGRAVLKDTYGEVFFEDTLMVRDVEKQKLFVVSFVKEGYVLGGCFSVAINKKDGKILRIWAGE